MVYTSLHPMIVWCISLYSTYIHTHTNAFILIWTHTHAHTYASRQKHVHPYVHEHTCVRSFLRSLSCLLFLSVTQTCLKLTPFFYLISSCTVCVLPAPVALAERKRTAPTQHTLKNMNKASALTPFVHIFFIKIIAYTL